ncbi:adenylyltransferase/sulfurtransferase [Chromobacterium alkanivorans]|uniref:HesA/MoeB/ThiF family protein n=1 Tax=Chromobacterium alkanivorans TaxID=1071719 RepID=UPI0021682D43|nr:molybdopterin-synthase adenylyltransferase MoeB [Chromobacterium alkanivorans]MCS3805420.1 adenylyltransferase/sulfurtransferase [Chromobacterium alkanivorans]MCS3819759.1 adenylyltransferase/sulfurtransferase [Chromobacterium alkanivorans]MCS3874266.1 adenylyltransferase/sulfurtransferase [Chromobacterium alkanivorans]
MTELNDQALLRYSRHILLPEIDIAGQQRLSRARALIVGAGGLGSPVALYLASAGVGRISIADDDVVELSNLQRQIVHDSGSLGRLKAESAADRMRGINPGVAVTALTRRLGLAELEQLAASHDLVLDCSDNFATRHAVNRACVAAGTPLVSGAAVRFSGQLAVFDPRDAASPCYHCLFPDEGEAGDGPCATFGVLSPLVGVIGSLQAVEAVKLLAGIATRVGWLTLYDGLAGEFRQIKVPRDPGCGVCAAR